METEADQRALVPTLRMALATGALRRCQLLAALWRLVDLATLVAVSVHLFAVDGAAAVALFGITRTLAPALCVPVVTAVASGTSAGVALAGASTIAALGFAAAGALVLSAGPTWAILATTALAAVGVFAFRPLLTSLFPQLVRTPQQLVAANAMGGLVDGTSSVAGPFLAGLAVVTVGPAWVLVVATVALGAGVAVAVPLRTAVPPPVRSTHHASRFDGFRALAKPPDVLLVVVLSVGQTTVRGALQVVVVVFAVETLGMGDGGPGVLLGAIGAGGLLAFPLALRIARPWRLGRAFAVALVLWGAPIALGAALPHPAVVLALFTVIGLGNDIVDITSLSLLQRLVPEERLTRMLGAFETVLYVGMAGGALGAGLAVEHLGVTWALVATGLVLPALAVSSLVRLRALDRTLSDHDGDVSLLRHQPFFAPLPMSVADRLARRMTVTAFAPGDVLMQEGDTGDRYVLIEEGEVDIVRDGSVIRRLGAHDGLGEVALVRDVPRSASAIAVTAVRARVLTAADFRAGIAADTDARAAAEALADARLAPPTQ